jgi:hypothetical protein
MIAKRRLVGELDMFRVNDRAVVLVGNTVTLHFKVFRLRIQHLRNGRFRFYYEELAERVNYERWIAQG